MTLGTKNIRVKVEKVSETVKKEDAPLMYSVIENSFEK